MSLVQAMEYTPRLLSEAVDRAIELHPNTARSLPGARGSRLDELIERLMACEGDEALREFGRAVSPRDERGLLSTLLRQEAVLTRRVVTAFEPHLRSTSLGPLWRIWQNVPLDDSVLELLRAGAERHGMASAVDVGWAERVAGWLRDDPLSGILRWADAGGLRMSELGRLRASPLQKEGPLTEQLWRLLLTTGSASQLRREDSSELRERGFSMGPEDVIAFGRNYLQSLPSTDWDVRVMETLRDRYGLPGAKRSRGAFWRPVDEEKRQAFRQHFLSRELKKAFGSTPDRHRFWQSWMDEIRDMVTGVAGQTDYAVLEFDNFGVVEFFEKNHAAFFYDLDTLEQMARRSVSHPGDLKVGRDRLIHRQGWERTANRKIRSRLQGSRRNR